jgi:hypothetical protein
MAQINSFLHNFHNKIGVQDHSQHLGLILFGFLRGKSKGKLSNDHGAMSSIRGSIYISNKHTLGAS